MAAGYARFSLDASQLKAAAGLSSSDEHDLVCTSYAPKQAPPRQVRVNLGTLAFDDEALEADYRCFHHQVLSELSDRRVQSLHV
jgi:hypothetical protein